MVYTIEVKKSHIERGTAGSAFHCPIARAFRAAGFVSVSVGSAGATLHRRNGINKRVTLPKRVQNFIAKFDDEKPVKPFTFRLTFPTK